MSLIQRSAVLLVVDDDRDIREALFEILREAGYEVIGAANGREALAVLRAHGHVDVVLLDLRMPEMDGAAFRRAQLRDAALAEVPVVVLSATVDCKLVSQSLRADGCLVKPFQVDALFEVIEAARKARRG